MNSQAFYYMVDQEVETDAKVTPKTQQHCSCVFSYSYSASRYAYSIDPSDTDSVCWIHRVNIDTLPSLHSTSRKGENLFWVPFHLDVRAENGDFEGEPRRNPTLSFVEPNR